ncbi:Tn3 family transposase, partial [Streptomyces sp. NPDC006482]|uniref:Tn3 family transposase n=1 Tax=Streptomyces sp. NPDC006482 TaxID=3154306 RepID=UPI0033A6B036
AYIQYADAPPPCDAPHLTPRADPPGITGQPLGTSEAEQILRRPTRSGPKHPTYQAIEELGQVVRTAIACDYLVHVERRPNFATPTCWTWMTVPWTGRASGL